MFHNIMLTYNTMIYPVIFILSWSLFKRCKGRNPLNRLHDHISRKYWFSKGSADHAVLRSAILQKSEARSVVACL